MCLLVNQPASTAFTDEFIEDVYRKNSDGFGVMYAEHGKVHVYKCLPRDAKDMIDFYRAHAEGRDCVWHARMQTHGDIDLDNCHPYRVTDDIWLAHNGILSTGNASDKTKSDTWHFIRNVLSPALTANPDLMLDLDWQKFVGSMIGTGNKFGLVRADGKTVIINETSGVNFVGAWLSNTYAWSAAAFGFRSAYQTQSGYSDSFSVSGRNHQAWWAGRYDEDEDYGYGYGKVGSSYPATQAKTQEAKGSYVQDSGQDYPVTSAQVGRWVKAAYNQWERRGLAGIEQWVKDAPHKAANLLAFWYDDVESIASLVDDDPEEAAIWIEDLFRTDSVTPSLLA